MRYVHAQARVLPSGRAGCLRELLGVRADVHSRSKAGQTPLMFAAMEGHNDLSKSYSEVKVTPLSMTTTVGRHWR